MSAANRAYLLIRSEGKVKAEEKVNAEYCWGVSAFETTPDSLLILWGRKDVGFAQRSPRAATSGSVVENTPDFQLSPHRTGGATKGAGGRVTLLRPAH